MPFSKTGTSAPAVLTNETTLAKGQNVLAWFLLIVLALIWGSSFILIKRGVAVFGATQVGAFRIFSAALVLLPLVLVNFRRVPKNKWPVLFLCGLIGNLLPSFLFSIAGARLNSSVSGILNALTPLFTLISGALFFQLRISAGKTIGLLIGFAGCVLLIAVNASGSLGFNQYAVLPVIATILYGVNANLVSRYLRGIKPLHIAALSIGSVGPLAGTYLAGTDIPWTTLQTDTGQSALGYVLILGIVGTAFATVLFNRLIQISGPLFTSSVTYLIPVVAVMWGVLDGELLTGWHYTSMAAIIAGVYLVNKSR
jgi:drug/metabolite transporter (DMT)-like permease